MIKNIFNPMGFQSELRSATGVEVGSAVTGTATAANAKDSSIVAENYLRNDLDKKIVLIAPSSTPIDTITRELGNTRATKSVETGGWEISVRDIDDKVTEAVSQASGTAATIKISKSALWQPGDTFRVFDGANEHVFYVDSKSSSTLTCTIVGETSIPAINLNAEIVRMSKAMSETAAQTTPVYQTPSSRTNYCQIHMAQIEESVVHALHEKEVAYDFATMKEQTIYDLKWRMEMANLWGKKASFVNAAGDRIYTSAGLWEQIDNSINFSNATFGNAEWISLTKSIFDGNNGSERRIALVGSDLMAYWANVPSIQKQLEAQNTEVVLGVKFNRVETNFGELLVRCASNTFIGSNSYRGIVIDPSYIRKEVYEALSSTPLDLDTTGVRRVKAERMLENYCLYVENQPVHCKVAKVTGGGSGSN